MTEVVIVGGGPTGLMLAAELRLAGVSPVVLERLPAPTGLSKALGIGGRTLDLLDARGMLPSFEVAGQPMPTGIAHFGGIPLPLERLRGDPPVRFLFLLQARTEALLEARARALDVEIRRGSDVVGLRQDDDGVTLDVSGPDGITPLRARYVVGCDGGRSEVRKLAGIGFPGTPGTMLRRLADVELEIAPGAPGWVPGRAPIVPLGGGVYRVVTGEPLPEGFDRDAPITRAEFEDSVLRTLGITLPIRAVHWLSRFTDASRQADRYRVGRVLLAGDAAHIHLPAGGPGLNTGLFDAVNLGWKLAKEVLGTAPPGLLDSYHAERHPVGRRVLMHTRAQGLVLQRTPESIAMRELLTELMQDEQALRRIVDLLQGYDLHYPMDETDPAPHPLVGRWVPDLALTTDAGPTRVLETLHGGRGLLLDLGGSGGWADAAADRVDVCRATCAAPPVEALLVRPDGMVAWVADGPDPRPRLERALRTWFGGPPR